LLLTTFTVVAVDFTFEAERVRAGARQVQSALGGARDRAIKAREARGIRFLVDRIDEEQDLDGDGVADIGNGRMVSSMVYIGAAQPWHQGEITLKRPDFDNDDVVDVIDMDGDGQADSGEIWMIDGSADTLWFNLKQRGFLGVYEDTNYNGTLDPGEDANQNGVLDNETPRIKIPGDKNGTWYRVRTQLLGVNPLNPNRLVLTRAYRDPGTSPASDVIAFEGTGPSTYELELPPRVLPDADPILLPEGVVIDLDASEVPDSWRPQSGPGGSAGHAVRYSSRMDVMFSPRGTITGTAAGAGLLHFYICRRGDVGLCAEAGRPPRYGSSTASWVPAPDLFDS